MRKRVDAQVCRLMCECDAGYKVGELERFERSSRSEVDDCHSLIKGMELGVLGDRQAHNTIPIHRPTPMTNMCVCGGGGGREQSG